MKSFIILSMVLVIAQAAASQNQTFDIVTFTPPKGWKKEVKGNLVAFTKTDKVKKSWCMIGVIKSMPSKGSIEEDFKNEWDILAVQQYQATSLQENEVQEAEGWKIKAGGGKFSLNNADAMVLLTTMSGYNVCTSILATTNSADFLDDIQNFLSSVNLQPPAAPPPAIEQPVTQPSTSNAGPANTGNFSYHTTNFDDGWTSVIKEDWVEVSKGDIKVYLWYGLPYNASDFSGTGKQERIHYWENYVSRYYNIETTVYDSRGVLSDISQKLIEGYATDKQTGQRRYLALRYYLSPNVISLILVSAPDEQALAKQFPKYKEEYTEDVSRMNYYNRFAIGKNDVNGTWVDGGTNAAYMYYSNGVGGYYGAMSVASTDSRFNLHGSTYDCVEKSTMGHVGALSSYKAEYKGKLTVTEWEVVMTGRFNGKTDTFSAWFEAAKGGRVLHLQNKQYTGTHYHLVKEK
jgi:hypothetical protein